MQRVLKNEVTYLFRCPDTLVVGVVDHRRLPLAVHLIVPVFRLDGVGVRDVLGLVPILGLLVVGVGNGGLVVPVFGLLSLWVLKDYRFYDAGPFLRSIFAFLSSLYKANYTLLGVF